MRARLINEIQIGGKSGLGSIGIGTTALTFARELEKTWPSFNNRPTLNNYVYVKEVFNDVKRKEILNVLNTKVTNIKLVEIKDFSQELLNRLYEIMEEDDTVEIIKMIPHSNYKEVKEYDARSDSFHTSKEPDGTYHEIKVSFQYNPIREVVIVRYTDNNGRNQSTAYIKL